MRAGSILGVALVATVLCIVYFEGTQGAAVGSASKVLSRVRRQGCPRPSFEPPGHRCNSNCECTRGRTCTTHGYCHADPRGRRMALDDEESYQDEQDDEGAGDSDEGDDDDDQDEQQDEYDGYQNEQQDEDDGDDDGYQNEQQDED